MGQLIGKREWETLYHGWNWADVVSDMGYVRDDGKTLVAQPHLNLDPKKMWTLDHLRRMAAAAEPQRAAQRDDPRGAAGVPRRLHPRGPAGRPAPARTPETRPRRQRERGGAAADAGAASSARSRPCTAEGAMADKHVVRFEPVGIEIEVDEEKTVLRAAAEQGLMLMHGCKEGQCAACKSFVLDGDDIELDKLLDLRPARLREGGGLHPAVPGARLRGRDDRAAQLRRGDDPLRPADPGRSRPRWSRTSPSPRHAAPGAAAGGARRARFFPGQYVDITVPGTETTRSFSMANTSSQGERAARVRHQGLPRRAVLPASWTAGWPSATRLDVVGPFGVVHPAGGPRRATWCSSAAARGWRRSCPSCAPWPSGAAPARPPTTTAPGAASDLCFEKELRRARGSSCPTSATCRPCPSRTRRPGTARSASSPTSCKPSRDGPQRRRLPTSAGRRRWSRRRWRRSSDLGASDKRIYYDKFTTTAPS